MLRASCTWEPSAHRALPSRSHQGPGRKQTIGGSLPDDVGPEAVLGLRRSSVQVEDGDQSPQESRGTTLLANNSIRHENCPGRPANGKAARAALYAVLARTGSPDALSLLATRRINIRVAFSRISWAASGRRARSARRAAVAMVMPC